MFLLGEFHGQRNLMGYSPKGHKELYTTEATYHASQDNVTGCQINIGLFFFLNWGNKKRIIKFYIDELTGSAAVN